MCWPLLAFKFYLTFCKFYLKKEINNNITNNNGNDNRANYK